MIKNKFIYYILSLIIIIVLINSLIKQNKIFKNIEKYEGINANSIIYAHSKRLINKNTINNTNLSSTIQSVNDIQNRINSQNDILANLGATDKLSEFRINNQTDCVFKDYKYKIPGSSFNNYECINGKNCHKACAEHCSRSDKCYGFIVKKNNNKDVPGINDDDNTSCWCSNVCHSDNPSFLINSDDKYMYTKNGISFLDGLANFRINSDTDCSGIVPIIGLTRNELNNDSDNNTDNINECATRCSNNPRCKSFDYNYSKGVNENVCNLYNDSCNYFTRNTLDGFTDSNVSVLSTHYEKNSFIPGNIHLDFSSNTLGLNSEVGIPERTLYIQ